MTYNINEIKTFFEEETDPQNWDATISETRYSEAELDDFDSEDYESLIGDIQDFYDPELNGYFDGLSEEEMAEFVEIEHIDSVIPKEFSKYSTTIKTIHNDLSNATKNRLQGNYLSCISICKDILSLTNNHCIQRYTKNLLIAAYGDIGDPKAFELAIDEMYSGNQYHDFKNTLLGLLSKDIKFIPEQFLNAMKQTQEDVLVKYYDSLSDFNSKKNIIWKVIHEKK